jgi:signal transduction histidine kinase
MLQDLTAHRALQQQIMHAQKVEALGRLAGGVAHDFNNLLTAILTSCDVLTDALADHDPRRQDAEDIRRTAIRATNLTKQLLTFSRDGGGTPKRTCLNDVVRDLERLVCRLVGPTLDVTVSVCSTPLFALVDPTRLEQVLMNLAVNARDAMPNGGRLEIALTADDAGDIPATRHGARRARLSVRDNGPGIAPEIIDHIFEPFFTTKDADHGTGLGLSICAAIVREAGGHLEVVSDHAGGSTFVVRLPVLEEPLASAEALRYA